MTRAEQAAAAAALARRDRRMRAAVATIGPPDLRRGRPRRAHFAELVRAICYQQLAGKAAAAIHGRFQDLFAGSPSPEAVLACRETDLRYVGLSASKVASIRDLAAKCLDGTVQIHRLGRLSDEDVVRELVQVHGIGTWTAHMFLIFQLGRPDVWPTGDYGVRKGYALLHDLDEMPSERALHPLGDPYRPYRSIAAWYCWRATDTVLPTG